MLISELLDDHHDALKAKKGEVADLHQGIISVVGKAMTEEIN